MIKRYWLAIVALIILSPLGLLAEGGSLPGTFLGLSGDNLLTFPYLRC